MSFQEEISPNVKLILPSMYKDIKENYLTLENLIGIYSKLHDNGIIEINVNTDNFKNDFNTEMNFAFKRYFNWFKDKDAVENVSITGINSNLELGSGSTRFSTISSSLSEIIYTIIKYSRAYKYLDQSYLSYFKVSEYFRFMTYKNGGQHFPHYDSDYIFNNSDYVTKYSLVIYHNKCEDGELYFCNDERNSSDSKFIITSDWDRQVREEEIYLKIKPDNLKIVIFPHTLCHGVLPFTGNERNIIRGDLIFLN